MSYSSSQEQTIYQRLAEQIQLGFFDNGRRFPSAQEIARQFGVSYCPAQRALKALQQAGLVEICRGRETVVVGKPYENYLESGVFRSRVTALADLCRTLGVLSRAVSFQGVCRTGLPVPPPPGEAEDGTQGWRMLYRFFEEFLASLGSQTAASLYYDISAFLGSAYADLLRASCGSREETRFLHTLAQDYWECLRLGREGDRAAAWERLGAQHRRFFGRLGERLEEMAAGELPEQVPFVWAPRKGRVRYCDLVALDLLCKINQGIYPEGSLLPGISALGDTYHVSPITVRRTVGLLNQLGAVRSVNGVGTRVLPAGELSMPGELAGLALADNLRTFLEAHQLLTITCEPVLLCAFPHFTAEALQAVGRAGEAEGEDGKIITATSACLQGVVHCCPLAGFREIYSKLTLLLLQGNALRLENLAGGSRPVWPDLPPELLEAAEAGDAAGFARAFRRLMEEIFRVMKTFLLATGMADVAGVADPVFWD